MMLIEISRWLSSQSINTLRHTALHYTQNEPSKYT